MNARDTAILLLEKAERAQASAFLLLKAGDMDGACNRAYYAMFDAAHAALLLNQPDNLNNIALAKTHNGLITAFSLQLVKAGILSTDLGRALNRAQEIRLIADYRGDSVLLEDAQEIIDSAKTFIGVIRSKFISNK